MLRTFLLIVFMGVVYWLATTFLPLKSPFPELLLAVMILAIIWELAAALGYVTSVLPRGPG